MIAYPCLHCISLFISQLPGRESTLDTEANKSGLTTATASHKMPKKTQTDNDSEDRLLALLINDTRVVMIQDD